MAQSIYVKTDTDEFVLKGRLCEVSAHSFIPPERNNPKELNYYNSDKKVLHLFTLVTGTFDMISDSSTVAQSDSSSI